MNLAVIEAGIYEQLGFNAVPDTAVINRIRRYINSTQHELLSMKGIGPKLRRTTLSMSTVAGSPFVTLPQSAVSIFIVQDRTNSVTLEEQSLSELRVRNPNLVTGGNPRAYAVIGFSEPTTVDPSQTNPGQLQLLSTSAGDIAITGYVEMVLTDGSQIQTTGLVTGVVQSAFGPTNPLFVQKFYMNQVGSGPVGTVTLLDNSNNVLSTLNPGRNYPRYTRLMVYPVPSSVITLYVDCEIHIWEMAQSGDEPYLPEDFHDLIEAGALKREYKKREKLQLYGIEDSRWRKRVAELRAFISRPGKTFSERRPSRFSQLGPWFSDGA